MKFIFSSFLYLMLSITATAQNSSRIIIKFKNGVDYQLNYPAKKIIQPLLTQIPFLAQLKSLGSLVNKNQPVNNKLKALELVRNIHFITLPDYVNIDSAISNLLNTGLFEYVEKDAVGTGAGEMLTVPTDPYFANQQWSLKNDGTFSGTAINDADIDMDNAWDITTGDANTIVCVLDAGFKMDHPELSGRIWQNTGEIAGNGIDDDGNGYIDDVQGWDWANNDNDPTDDHGHGTNVGSIIAAKGNNAAGMAGINWNCKLMVGKILDASNSGFYSWWESGIYYAVANGAKVINMSVGGSSFSATMKDACDFAMANNVMIAVCMHNQNTSAPYYPAAYASVIAVGSTSDNDWRTVPFPWSATSGSNYGSHIDLVAPGNNILGAYNLNNTSYNYWAGTSQATPEVAGVISLMLTLKPNLSFAQVMNVLATTSQDMVGNPAEDVPGWDQYYGFGRLNAAAALNAVLALVPLQFLDIAATRHATNNEISWNTLDDADTKKFVVEYTTDRMNWQTIREVNPAANTLAEKHYAITHMIDDRLAAFYRIKAVKNDDAYFYSKIVSINKRSEGGLKIGKIIAGHQQVTVFSSSAKNTAGTCFIYSIDGKLCYKAARPIPEGNGQLLLPVNLSAGRYELILQTKGEKLSAAFIIP